MSLENIEGMTLLELREAAKSIGLKNISRLKKSELQEEIKKHIPKSIEVGGVKLVEKYHLRFRLQLRRAKRSLARRFKRKLQ